MAVSCLSAERGVALCSAVSVRCRYGVRVRRSVADNELETLAVAELNGARGLRVLRAPGNRLRAPPAALAGTPRLQAL